MLRYQPNGGRTHERRIIADRLGATLVGIYPECLLVASGGQHALATMAFGLFRHSDAIATDTMTYPGFKSVAALKGLECVPIEGHGRMMNPDDLEKQCRERKVRAVYPMLTVLNPVDMVMDETTRLRLVEIARRHGLVLIEDAANAFREPDPPPSLFALAPERTIYVGSFSKSLATGLRLGYVICSESKVERLIEAFRARTWNAPAVISGLVAGWIDDGTLLKSEENRRQDGADRQRQCRNALAGSHILSHQKCRICLVASREHGIRSEPIVTRLKEHGLSVSGADPFATTVAVPQALRLAFGGLQKDELKPLFQIVRDTAFGTSIPLQSSDS